MTSNESNSAAARNAQAEALVASYERAGYARATPLLIQPADPFLDLSGEDLRKQIYLTTDAAGEEMCLRPDLTIPVSRDYLASPQAGAPAGFCYFGRVFRAVSAGPTEFMQAGIESFGRTDTAQADAEMLALALETAAHYGIAKPEIRMGDVGLYMALVAALDLPPAWKRRLNKDFNRKTSLAHDLDQLALRSAAAKREYQGVLAAFAGTDPKAAHALVTDLLSIAGINAVGGRSVAEIADRFLEQSALGATNSALPEQSRAVIERFLAIRGTPQEALAALRAMAGESGVALDGAIALFEQRMAALTARGIDLSRIEVSTDFGRGLDYYTGFVFEIHDAAAPEADPLVAGGRYDELLQRLGADRPIPAVGFAAWIERLASLGSRA
ncbi:MAG TPA: ATP phosphoribosyltransferase regulatory subunit [Xanthobacteraceae bacterium]|nr:ATP phosphoribosyltransferase regulatory subunit [Xanthobacteraceae bacterium]